MNLTDIKNSIVPELQNIGGVTKAGVFGSYARGDSGADSDIDILITLEEPTSLLTLVGIEKDLEESLGRPVDLVTEKSLSPYIKDDVLEQVEIIYER